MVWGWQPTERGRRLTDLFIVRVVLRQPNTQFALTFLSRAAASEVYEALKPRGAPLVETVGRGADQQIDEAEQAVTQRIVSADAMLEPVEVEDSYGTRLSVRPSDVMLVMFEFVNRALDGGRVQALLQQRAQAKLQREAANDPELNLAIARQQQGVTMVRGAGTPPNGRG